MTHPPAYVRCADGIVHRLAGDNPACATLLFGELLEYLPSIEEVDADSLCFLCWLEPRTLEPVLA